MVSLGTRESHSEPPGCASNEIFRSYVRCHPQSLRSDRPYQLQPLSRAVQALATMCQNFAIAYGFAAKVLLQS